MLATVDDMIRRAKLIKERDKIDREIAKLINLPAQIGHAGEYIAAAIFDIHLKESASNKAIDGRFLNGPLQGSRINVKWYTLDQNLRGVSANAHPDFYLVLAGPKASTTSSKGTTRPWGIDSLYLFHTPSLLDALEAQGVKFGVATSVRWTLWDEAVVYPQQRNSVLPLADEQRRLLSLFRNNAIHAK